MKIPSPTQAKLMLSAAERRNPGAWVQHSLSAGRAAESIAMRLADLESDTAFSLGILHDIGRQEGRTGMRHILDGYNHLIRKGFDSAARICITHSFPIKDIHAVEGPPEQKWDCTSNEFKFIQTTLCGIEYDKYDKLIQLCDALSLPAGYCLIEKRFVDVALRHGFNPYTLARWEAYLQLKDDFEKEAGVSLYDLLPGVVENTFNINLVWEKGIHPHLLDDKCEKLLEK
jgi:hypothetical protein